MRLSKKWLFIFFASLMPGCSSNRNWKELDLKAFKISMPQEWNYQRDRGIDSFAGEIKGPKVILFFDYSEMGYANHLKELPEKEHVRIDTVEQFIIKTLWPKLTGNGMTGIYIHSRKSNFNFQMNGKNLSAEDQQLALQAFKTIRFKN